MREGRMFFDENVSDLSVSHCENCYVILIFHCLQSKEFEIYSDYCNNHPSASEELKDLYKNKKYRHFFEVWPIQ